MNLGVRLCLASVFYGYPDKKIPIFAGSIPLDQYCILFLVEFALLMYLRKKE